MKPLQTITIGLILYSTTIYATPNFAREYGVSCSTCHTMIPTLNETGEGFLRNGFRFSSGDKPTLKKIIDPAKEESRPIPLAVMLNANYDSEREDVQSKVKLYGGGTLTENLSFFGMTKETFNDGKSDQEIFTQQSSRLYAQLNLKGNQHLLRAGIISPLTQFGNIQKSTADAGLKGHNSNSGESQREGGERGSTHQKYGNSQEGNNQGNQGNSNQGNQGQQGGGNQGGQGGNTHYQTPLQNASVGNIKGAEYSYLAKDRLMVLLSYGEPVDKSNRNSSQGNQSLNDPSNGEDDYQLMGGVRYLADNGYRVGLIYNQYEKMGQENFSALLPLEKRFDNLHWVSTLVYRDENSQESQYYGWENSLIYALTERDYLRGVVDVGTEDREDGEDDSYGLSLTYSRSFDYALIHLTGARRSSPEEDENLFLGSLSLLF